MSAKPPYTNLEEAEAYKKKLDAEDAAGTKKHIRPPQAPGDDFDYSPEYKAVRDYIIKERQRIAARSKEEKEQLRKERLKNSQCVLIANLNEIVRSVGVQTTEEENKPLPKKPSQVAGSKQAKKTVSQQTQSEWGIQGLARILPYMGSPESVLGQLLSPKNCSALVNAPNNYLAALVPRINFYIQTEKSIKQVFFSDFTMEDRAHAIAQTLSGNGGNFSQYLKSSLGAGVGIESFSWNFDNKHEGNRIIKASLSLHFASVLELVKSDNYLEFLTLKGSVEGTTRTSTDASGQQLTPQQILEKELESLDQLAKAAVVGGKVANTKTARIKGSKNKDHKVLKVVVGWQVPDAAELYTTQDLEGSRSGRDYASRRSSWDQFKIAVQRSQKVISLQTVAYSIDFQQQGQVKLSVEMVGSIDQYFMSPQADVLRGAASLAQPPGQRLTEFAIEPRDSDFADPGVLGAISAWWSKSKNAQTSKTGFRVHKTLPMGRIRKAIYAGITKETDALKGKYDWWWQKNLTLATWGSDVSKGRALISQDEVEAEIEFLEKLRDVLEYAEQEKINYFIEKRKNPYYEEYNRNLRVEALPDKLVNEVDLLHYSLDDVKIFISEAEEILQEVRSANRSEKYAAFLNMLLSTRRLFYVEMDVSAFKNRSSNPGAQPGPYPRLDLKPLPATKRATMLAKSKIAALSKTAKKGTVSAKDIEKYAGSLDPEITDTEKFDNIEKGKAPVFFLRLGDIIDVGLLNFDARETEKVVLGTFDPEKLGLLTSPDSKLKYINIADIPISMDFFGQWFLDNVIKKEIDVYPFRGFVNDLLNGLVAPLINYDCNLFKNQSAATLQFDFATIESAIDLDDPERVAKKGRVVTQQDFKLLRRHSRDKIDEDSMLRDDLNSYFIIHTGQMSPDRNGNKQEDEDQGIYHLTFGADRGLVKSMSFSEKTMPQLRAMNIEGGTGDTRAGVLVLPQDVTVNLVGNALFRNGQIVYVNADMAMGQRIARQLKIGGYYKVIKSSNEISMGGFNTTLNCMFLRNAGEN